MSPSEDTRNPPPGTTTRHAKARIRLRRRLTRGARRGDRVRLTIWNSGAECLRLKSAGPHTPGWEIAVSVNPAGACLVCNISGLLPLGPSGISGATPQRKEHIVKTRLALTLAGAAFAALALAGCSAIGSGGGSGGGSAAGVRPAGRVVAPSTRAAHPVPSRMPRLRAPLSARSSSTAKG